MYAEIFVSVEKLGDFIPIGSKFRWQKIKIRKKYIKILKCLEKLFSIRNDLLKIIMIKFLKASTLI